MSAVPDNQPFIIQNINNGILSSVKAMPQRDMYNDGSTFAQSREEYTRTSSSVVNKKWFGNRDSSTVIERRRYNAIGKGSLNLQGVPTKFAQHNDINTTRDALIRVRNSGYVTTPKVRANPNNNLTPSWQSGPLIRTQNHAPVALLGLPTDSQYTTFRSKGGAYSSVPGQNPVISFAPVLTDTAYYNRVRHRTIPTGTVIPPQYH